MGESKSKTPVVVVVGQGYVGLPLSMGALSAGYDVIGYEIEPAKVALLNDGSTYIDDITDTELANALETGRFVATSDQARLAGFDVAVITVPTPLRDGAPDLSAVEDASLVLGAHIRPGCCVILESTTWPGTTAELVKPILEQASGLRAGSDFSLGYSPERIDPGNATWGLRNTPKVVAGIDAASLKAVEAFYSSFVTTTVEVSTLEVAELSKLLENTFRHVNIALVNELAVFSHRLGIDIWETIDAASTKPFGFMRFTPGPGVGGHCLPIDPSYLAWRISSALGESFRLVSVADDVNRAMPEYVVQRSAELLNNQSKSIRGSKVLVLGIAYKKNTADTRESPALAVIESLRAKGAIVHVTDPHVDDDRLKSLGVPVELDRNEASSSDLILLLADHDAFDLDLLASVDTPVLDTRRVLSSPNAVSL